MDSFKISWKASAARELRRLPRDLVNRVVVAVQQLSANPHPPGSKKLVGSQQTYRIRLGDYRVIYNVVTQTASIEIISVAHRRDVYR